MRRASLILTIGPGQVHGLWEGASWSGGVRQEAGADFAAGDTPALSDALGSVLAAILPARRLTSPFVRITLDGPLIMAAILPFSKLPKSQADRRLVVSQRFCREHRLEPGKVEVIGSPLSAAKAANGRILCLAVEQDVLRHINGALSARGLYADVIVPGFLFKFEQADCGALEKPGIALFGANGFNTILVWDGDGSLIHIMTIPQPRDAGARERMAGRLWRYAQIVASANAPVALYLDRSPAQDLSQDLRGLRGLKLMAWPAERQDPGRAGLKSSDARREPAL